MNPTEPRNEAARQLRFCVVVPMYNEEGNVATMVREVNQAISDNGYRADIILVDDGSRDNTAAEAAAAGACHPNVIVKTHRVNSGFGMALRTAQRSVIEGGYDFAVFMDADFTMNPAYIGSFYQKMLQGYDFVIGSRFLQGGGMRDVPEWRKLYSRVGRAIFRLCFRLPLTDYTQGFRAIRGNILAQLELTEKGFPILIEEIFQARHLTDKFTEIPFVLTGREVGISKFNYTPKVLWDYFKYALRAIAHK